MELSRERRLPGQGLLYPLLVIAAIAVIVFSIIGMAAIGGWMPHAMVGGPSAVSMTPDARLALAGEVGADKLRAGAAFQCAECGVIESIREIEQTHGSSASLINDTSSTSVAKGQRF